MIQSSFVWLFYKKLDMVLQCLLNMNYHCFLTTLRLAGSPFLTWFSQHGREYVGLWSGTGLSLLSVRQVSHANVVVFRSGVAYPCWQYQQGVGISSFTSLCSCTVILAWSSCTNDLLKETCNHIFLTFKQKNPQADIRMLQMLWPYAKLGSNMLKSYLGPGTVIDVKFTSLFESPNLKWRCFMFLFSELKYR